MHLIAAREFIYAGRKVGAGQVFDAVTASDADVLQAVGLASPMPIDTDPEPEPDDEPDPDEPVIRRPRGRPRKVS